MAGAGVVGVDEADEVLLQHDVEKRAALLREREQVPGRDAHAGRAEDGDHAEPPEHGTIAFPCRVRRGDQRGEGEPDGTLRQAGQAGTDRRDDQPATARAGRHHGPGEQHERHRRRQHHVDARTGGRPRPLERRREDERRRQRGGRTDRRPSRRPRAHHGGGRGHCGGEAHRELGRGRQRARHRRGEPVVQRRLARDLTFRPLRHGPRARAQHLAHHQALARLAARVEGHVPEAGPVGDQAGEQQDRQLPACAHEPPGRVCSRPPPLVSRAP